MKNFKTLMAAILAVTVAAPSMAVVTNVQINDRISAILDKIGVDGTGFDSSDSTDYGTLGNFDASGVTWGGESTSLTAADAIDSFTIINTTVYVPAGGRDGTAINTDIESMLLDALAFKVDELTGDIGDLTNSYSAGSLAFQTIIDDRTGLNADDTINYGSADAQTWFGVKNSLDIFTASAEAWVAGIGELNSTSGTDGSHFANGAVLSETYDDSKDATSDVLLTVQTFAADGTSTDVDLNLGFGYDRDSLVTASIASGSTTVDERNGILSGETIFGTARHVVDASGYAADIVSSLVTTVTIDTSLTTYTHSSNGWSFVEQSDGTWNLLEDDGTVNTTGMSTASVNTSIAAWDVSGLYLTIEADNALDGVVVYYGSDGFWHPVSGAGQTYNQFDSNGVFDGSSGSITGGSATFTSFDYTTTSVETINSTITGIPSSILGSIKNSEIRGYAEEVSLGTVDTTTSPQWLQDLVGL